MVALVATAGCGTKAAEGAVRSPPGSWTAARRSSRRRPTWAASRTPSATRAVSSARWPAAWTRSPPAAQTGDLTEAIKEAGAASW